MIWKNRGWRIVKTWPHLRPEIKLSWISNFSFKKTWKNNVVILSCICTCPVTGKSLRCIRLPLTLLRYKSSLSNILYRRSRERSTTRPFHFVPKLDYFSNKKKSPKMHFFITVMHYWSNISYCKSKVSWGSRHQLHQRCIEFTALRQDAIKWQRSKSKEWRQCICLLLADYHLLYTIGKQVRF